MRQPAAARHRGGARGRRRAGHAGGPGHSGRRHDGDPTVEPAGGRPLGLADRHGGLPPVRAHRPQHGPPGPGASARPQWSRRHP
ncbi:hypothetical protein [Ornithinimicrobium kibberense]|uniref:hypothetical protein n=1 Tax=Ornithinimicrobium kibberense TaxID=282060 RepID=UPI0036104086